jgi:hypothetical protein
MNLLITFLNGESLTLEVEGCSDQGGLFTWGGSDIINQAKRYGYVAARDGVALALNGEAGSGIDCYPMASIKKLKLVKS